MHRFDWMPATLGTTVTLCLVLTAGFLHADIYKCVSKDGVVTFSDRPCSADAEILLDEMEISLDEAVEEASPFADITIDSQTAAEVMLAHARKMGKCILPDEPFNEYLVEGGERGGGRYPSWAITLKYGPPEKPSKWRIRMEYKTRHVDGVPRVWLTTVFVLLWSQYEDPPTMEKTQTLEKVRTGKYQLVGWI